MRKKLFRLMLAIAVVVAVVATLVACGETPPPPAVDAESITLSQSSLTLEVGGNASLSATVKPDNADKTVTWKSSNTSVATVSNGVVKAKAVGDATITATTHNGKSASCNVKVNPYTGNVIPVEGVSVVPSTHLFENVGDTYTLDAKVWPNIATYQAVTWVSLDEDIATVTADGIVTAVGLGKVEVRAVAHNDVYGVCNVNVKSPVNVKFIFNGQVVGKTTTYAEDGGTITIPDQIEPEEEGGDYLAVPDISTNPDSLKYIENWYLDANFETVYTDGMNVCEDLAYGEEVKLYGKEADAYQYDIINGQDGNYIMITEFVATNARYVNIPTTFGGHNVTVIGEGAFEGSTLTGVKIPGSVVTIYDDAFRDCTKLGAVDFQNSGLLTHIGDSAFRGCSALDEIAIPDSVTFLGTLALYGTDMQKSVQLSSRGVAERQYYAPKFVFEFLGEDVMPIGAYSEIKSNERVVNGQIANVAAGVCDPENGVGLETALREFVESGCNLMEANSLVNAVQSQDPTKERSYGHYFKLLEEYGGMMLYRDMSLYGMLYEEYEGNAGANWEKNPNLYEPTASATLNSYINNLYPQFASFAGVLVKDEPGWVDWIDEFEEPYTYYQRTGSSASSDLAVDGDGNYIELTKAKGRMDDGLKVWREYMPDKLFFVNLLQTYAPKWALPNGYYGYNDAGQLDGIPNFTGDNAPKENEIDYEYYYRTYIQSVKPQVFSYDYYPLAGSGTDLYNTHFEQLDYANYYAGDYYKEYHGTETGIPFWPMIQLAGWNGYRPTKGAKLSEVNWQINTALAYGAKGYTYFTYSATGSHVGTAIDQYGNKTASYDIVKTANSYAQAMAKWLLNAEVDHLAHIGANPNRFDPSSKQQASPEVTPTRMLTPKDQNMTWTLTNTSSQTSHIVSYMKYYANNNYYDENVDGDVQELYFICNNTISNEGVIYLNFNKHVTGSYILGGREYKFSGTQLKITLFAGEGAAILLDK